MIGKTILFIGGSVETIPAIEHAKKLGYTTFVTDGSIDSPCFPIADDLKIASIYDIYDTIQVAIELNEVRKISGVVAVACDVGPIVSLVAKELGLPHIPHVVTRLSWDKRMLKAWLYPRKIRVPSCPSLDDKYWAIKPNDSRGGRGVFKVLPGSEIDHLVKESRQFSPSEQVLIERWIPGPQISSETIVWEGECVFTCLSDRNYADEFLPHIIEDGGEAPSRYEGTASAEKIRFLLQELVSHLGIESGTVKGDIVLDEENEFEPVLIECAIGRMGPSVNDHWPMAYGIDFLRAAFSIACGDDPSQYLEQSKTKFTCGRYEMLGSPTDSTERGEFFFATGEIRDEAIHEALAIRQRFLERL